VDGIGVLDVEARLTRAAGVDDRGGLSVLQHPPKNLHDHESEAEKTGLVWRV
jgi:hypothetical protein